ncbi:MAG: DNA sulfur modification protein DndD [Desulfobulbaceae bacterium]|nr:DNA sulfur modification protein DndD [Desulfobulbaceae bacterium]
MLFKSITITNLFSYYEDKFFDLSISPESKQNIIVLMGRNGSGKTSFINSVKLLFIGTAEEIRRTVQRNRTPTEKQYICGIDNEWAGILNLKAKKQDINECGIKIIWDSEDGEVIAERKWQIDFQSNSYTSQLTVKAGFKGHKEGEDAKDYLEQCLPKAYLPYFFFDGEEVQSLAESNSKELISTMERLLNIRPLENVQAQLHVLCKNWQKSAMDREIALQLIEVGTELERKTAKQSELDQKNSDTQDELAEKREVLDQITRDLQLLWAIPNQASEARLQEKKALKEERREELLMDFADGWQRDSFLRVLPELIENALNTAESIAKNNTGTHKEFLESLTQRLPTIFSSPPFPSPRLEPSQSTFYQKRILKELEIFSVEDQNDTLFDIDSHRANLLTRVLAVYHPSRIPALQIHEKLSEAQSIRQELFTLEKQLRDTGDLSQKQQEEYAVLQDKEQETKNSLLELELQLKKLQNDHQNNSREMNGLTKEMKIIEKALEVAQENRQQYKFAKSLIDILDEVKKRLKIQKRKELEKTYNQHLGRLLDSNTLINHIEIDEQFIITYRDSNGEKVGMSSISAGMKQLSATALLWALKDVSGRDLPIIIDTPMGRIDRQHQDNLLREYYPSVGKQMILLPTDSELDERKHAMLESYICREYELYNPEGKETKVVPRHG